MGNRELIERLRAKTSWSDMAVKRVPDPLCAEAADRIEELGAERDHAILNRNKLAKKVAVLIAEIPERAWSNGLWDRLAEAEKSIVATTPEGE